MTYPWKEHYVKQPETLAYLNHVTDRHDLRKHMRFDTEMISADWTDDDQTWSVKVTGEKVIKAKYLVNGLGLLSKINFPDIPGLHSFEGDLIHTARWPKDYDVTGKRVAIIGCGSTGVQVITEIGRKVGELTCYQRHPQYSVPSGDREVTKEERQWMNDNWDNIFHKVRNSVTGFGIDESTTSFHDVTPNERERIFQEAWDKGNGFRFMFATFNDIATDVEANKGAQEFIRNKIDSIVKDPEKARKLKPHDLYARRPLCDGNASNGQKYFEQFNRPNVDIIDLRSTPIDQIEATGIRTSDGQLHPHDLIIAATGFDAVEGNYTRLQIHGRSGVSLKQFWDDLEPTSYLGLSVPEFPNLFMIGGPKGPFTNVPPAIEAQVEFLTEMLADAEAVEEGQRRPIEATHEAEREYSRLCEELAASSLFWKAEVSFTAGVTIVNIS